MSHVERAMLWLVSCTVIAQTVARPNGAVDWVGVILATFFFVMSVVEMIRSFRAD